MKRNLFLELLEDGDKVSHKRVAYENEQDFG